MWGLMSRSTSRLKIGRDHRVNVLAGFEVLALLKQPPDQPRSDGNGVQRQQSVDHGQDFFWVDVKAFSFFAADDDSVVHI